MSATLPLFSDNDTDQDPIRFRRLSGEIVTGSAWHMAVEFAAPWFNGGDAA